MCIFGHSPGPKKVESLQENEPIMQTRPLKNRRLLTALKKAAPLTQKSPLQNTPKMRNLPPQFSHLFMRRCVRTIRTFMRQDNGASHAKHGSIF